MAWYADDPLDGVTPKTPLEEVCEAEEARAGAALREEEVREIRRETYQRILRYIFSGGRNTEPTVVLANVLGLVKSHAPDLVDGVSLAKFSAMMGRTKAALSHQIRHYQNEVIALNEARQGREQRHHTERWQLREEAVETFREAQKGNGNRSKKQARKEKA